MFTIRGATTVENDCEEDINSAVKEMIALILKENNITIDDVISIIFSCTRDLKSCYPAKAAREMGFVRSGLMCFNEMYVDGSLEKCIRVLFFIDKSIKQKDAKHIYLRGAANLRSDILKDF